jgi:hypothetical protein
MLKAKRECNLHCCSHIEIRGDPKSESEQSQTLVDCKHEIFVI